LEWCEAIDLAKETRLLLQPVCERVEIAGSVRRLKPEVNDIEIVAVPKRDPFDQLQLRLADMVSHKYLLPGPESKDGKRPPMGPRYYRLTIPMTHAPGFMQLDLFAVLPPADFGVIYTIRTGSAAFSHWLVTEALKRGMKVDQGQLWRIHREEQPWRFERLACPEESDFFGQVGLDWVEPKDRELPPVRSPNTSNAPRTLEAT
jgi:DNA polymerase/3'-5' exonuclease PolX